MLMVVVAAMAMALVGATSAMAETTQEKAQWQAFANCPFHEFGGQEGHEITICPWAQSSYKERWSSKKEREAYESAHGTPAGLLSHFSAGNISVALKLPITLKGGAAEKEVEGQVFEWVGAKGSPTIQPVAQAGPSLAREVNKADLSAAELARYTYYRNIARETRTTATVELAGPATNIKLDLAALLEGVGTAFSFPVKVKLGNKFFGDNCYVGSDEHPIVVNFTTGTAGELQGKLGNLSFNPEGTILTVWGDTLVASGFASPGVENCGVEGGADAAMDAAIGLPSASNTSVLNGVLKQTGSEEAIEHLGI